MIFTAAPAWGQEATQNTSGFHPQLWLRNALQWIDSLGAVGALAFILLYIIATVAFLPGSILTLGAGVVFGVVMGSVYVFIGATIGATAAFLVGRYLARGWVAKKIAGNAKFRAIDEAVGREGLKIVLLTRLSPIFPFNLLNYAYGVTGVSLKDYFLGSVGMIPGTIMYVYIGSLAGNIATIGTDSQPDNPGVQWAIRIIGLIATVAVTIYVTKVARQALEEQVLQSTENHENKEVNN
ncbi:TVP38/TMEM64 family protein [Nodularia chucula]|uniref:TVP38/TMEM64 family protein n=1 Tax=Nodularia chucula TaxID=3093667 RepID=UPI0039C67353